MVMGSFLMKLLSAPTNSLHNDYGIHLDLSYITKRIIVCSCPVSSYPKLAYRNSINDLINYLQIEHRNHWSIWNLKLESPNDYSLNSRELQDKIFHFPWPDHQPSSFKLLLNCLHSIDQFLKKDYENVVVIHCKMGKGRSGLVVCAYLMLYLNFTKNEACELFTSKRMKPGFGNGVSIISQLEYLSYCELYSKCRSYKPQKIAYIETIKIFHVENSYTPLLLNFDGYSSNDELVRYFELDSKSYIVSQTPEYSMYKINLLIEDQDIRLTIKPVERTGVTLNAVYTWFNLHWYLYKSICHSQQNTMMVRLNWNRMDGFKGTSFKGKQCFEVIELKIRLIDI
ncbi:Phosphatidylinositol-3,4,5-trisphosphate 3-phosphatase [Wickerhamomyces ciferrii]|uniref:phosphatidylinositol-3,4,5-trisphosphate 3-phosphatase n=1 Tax=Wickerhamomyces ciferrii (strain ATCC 14091 / BCRC 22168 / CBS 111 / JCM 3599 / NBRC 0793 / NRRL Y-1031 F-60-10) TaxID=1206466 RepID=K0KDG5_WICCF|nr:Phosphatidylinositol-3,4,5-trisphosphate 3-phosphatase [Wickerhamomyces ciferrii]CCH40961.1 Phosphatidylinositol-3,4,5-trisphosphate 3-phosphatase [Wickerhamomyces ciferrii]